MVSDVFARGRLPSDLTRDLAGGGCTSVDTSEHLLKTHILAIKYSYIHIHA